MTARNLFLRMANWPTLAFCVIALLGGRISAAGQAPKKKWCADPGHQSLRCSCIPPDFIELSGEVRDRIDDVRSSLEEWGTLGLSGVVLAPPSGSFGIDATGEYSTGPGTAKKKYDFKHWFEEASRAEGSVQFTERIFNSFAASGSLQLAPEQAAIAQSFLDKQKTETELFQKQLERGQVQRAAELEDFQANRTNAVQARQFAINSAQVGADRAATERAEAQVVRNQTEIRRTTAIREMEAAQLDLDRIPADVPNAAQRQEKGVILQQKQAAFELANLELQKADDDLRSRTANEKLARDKLASAKEANISTGVLPGALIDPITGSPVLHSGKESGFTFAQEITPGQALTAAKSFASSIPTVNNPKAPPGIASSELPPLLGKASGIESAFPARARLIDAASNQMIARIFDFLGDPSAALVFEDKPILMAAGTMAVNPGWRTAREYDGQIDVATFYEWKPARRETCERISKFGDDEEDLFNEDEIRAARYYTQNGLWPRAEGYSRFTGYPEKLRKFGKPLAAAVSPLMERQNLDQASSRARQDEIALFLSASLAKSGQKAAGEVFNKYMRLRRLDVKTLSSLPVVNSYGLGGGHFGFNVTSRLQATGDINKPKPGLVLEKQNFPVLIVFGLSSDNLRPRLVCHEGRAELWEPRIVLKQTHRWSRQKKRGVFHQSLRSVFLPGFPGRPMEDPEEDYRLLNRFNESWERYTYYLEGCKTIAERAPVKSFKAAAEEDRSFLNAAYFYATTELQIPVSYLTGPVPEQESARTAITQILPPVLTPRKINDTLFEAEIILLGRNLKSVKAEEIEPGAPVVTIAKIPLPPGVPADKAIALKLSFAARPDGPIQLALPGGEARGGFQPMVYSPMITFQY